MARKSSPLDELVKLRKQRDFASRLTLMMTEAGQIELYATMHKIHDAVRMVGYEMAGDVTLYEKAKRR